MLNTAIPFIIFAECEVIYAGRATSTLERGRYLIIYKPDKSITIHASDQVLPRNYMGAGSNVELESNTLIIRRKKETITITIIETVSVMYPENWADHHIKISRTEKELSLKIFNNWCEYFDGEFNLIQMEFPTPVGPIDVFGISADGVYHIVETKRKRATLANVSQLRRYVEAFPDKPVKGFLAAPSISPNALKLLKHHGMTWLEIDFDPL